MTKHLVVEAKFRVSRTSLQKFQENRLFNPRVGTVGTIKYIKANLDRFFNEDVGKKSLDIEGLHE